MIKEQDAKEQNGREQNGKTLKFNAEIGKVLHLMIHSLYTNKDIFLRELISNASDACDKLRYLSAANSGLYNNANEFKISIMVNTEERTITVTDNGIGMNQDELIANIGTIASSGTQKFLDKMTGDSKSDMQLIGQFGVGFYSSFMVSDKVTIITRKTGDNRAWRWESNGDGEYIIDEIKENIPDCGTSVILHIREGEDNYLDNFKIRHIIKTYSDHILFPIEYTEYVDKEIKKEIINDSSALWMKNKSDISDEQYKNFYKSVSYQPDSPWMIIHNKNEGTIEYTNLLFIPSTKPFDLFHPDRKCRVKLYVNRVYITDDNIELVPAYMRFIRGVIDSGDLPLNISRETLQNNHVVDKIRKSVIKRVLGDLKKKLELDREDYIKFWNNFGPVLKEGLCESTEVRENLLDICLFRSALSDKIITLKEYVDSMQEGQEYIYYLCGDNPAQLKNSPQLEGLISKNIDVLLMTDTVDDFWVNVQNEYQGKELKSATRADIDTKPNDDDSKNEEHNKDDSEALISFFRETLGNLVKDIKISKKLVASPVCLAVSEGAMDIRMERYLIDQKQLPASSAKILEINIEHPILKNIISYIRNDKNDLAKELAYILLDEACILEGEPVHDKNAFAKRLNSILA